MSRCVVCNREILEKAYFCDDCLREQRGTLRKPRRPSLLPRLVMLPFHTLDYSVPITSDGDESAKILQEISLAYPGIDLELVASHAGISVQYLGQLGMSNPPALQNLISRWLTDLGWTMDNVPGIREAPWDIVLQPALFALVLAVGVAAFVLVAAL